MNETVFCADTGVQVPAVTADEMAAVDRIAVEEFGIDLLQMTENAGRTLASHTRQVGSEPVQVLAGNGGNGGGGLVCARHLLNRDVNVEVVLDRPPDALDGVAAAQNAIIEEMDGTTRVGADALEETTGTIVDALIGYGLDGEVRDSARSFSPSGERIVSDGGFSGRAVWHRRDDRGRTRDCRQTRSHSYPRAPEDGASTRY